MALLEFNEELHEKSLREEGFEEGLLEGVKEGIKDTFDILSKTGMSKEDAVQMIAIQKAMTIEEIIKIIS